MITNVKLKENSHISEILKYNEINFKNNVVVLTGTNGAGKSTLLKSIASLFNNKNKNNKEIEIDRDNNNEIKLLEFYCRTDNGKYRGYFEDTIADVQAIFSSEGQSAVLSFNRFMTKQVVPALDTGKDVLLIIDELDSGLSVDNVVMFAYGLKNFASKFSNLQIIMSANQFEFMKAFQSDCIWLHTGEYKLMNDYDEYLELFTTQHNLACMDAKKESFKKRTHNRQNKDS